MSTQKMGYFMFEEFDLILRIIDLKVRIIGSET